jgi:hypothetical protein
MEAPGVPSPANRHHCCRRREGETLRRHVALLADPSRPIGRSPTNERKSSRPHHTREARHPGAADIQWHAQPPPSSHRAIARSQESSCQWAPMIRQWRPRSQTWSGVNPAGPVAPLSTGANPKRYGPAMRQATLALATLVLQACSTAFCTPSTCMGCCDTTTDQCVAGTTSASCGPTNGTQCFVCKAGEECVNHRCEPTPCKNGGLSCDAFSECCSGSCTVGKCDAIVCDGTGEACKLPVLTSPGAGSCCNATDACYAGSCRRCGATLTACVSSTDCCSGRCAQGKCASTCDEGRIFGCGTCCAGLTCVSVTETAYCGANQDPYSCYCGRLRCLYSDEQCGRGPSACCEGLTCQAGKCK